MKTKLGAKWAVCLGGLLASSAVECRELDAAPPERPTFNHTADPRPNILPNWVFNHHVPYRATYNRPTYYGGKAMSYVFSPTSQEALAWEENLARGRYNGHHCPPLYKSFNYPKPWEMLNTGPRPNTIMAATVVPAMPPQVPSDEAKLEQLDPDAEVVPSPK